MPKQLDVTEVFGLVLSFVLYLISTVRLWFSKLGECIGAYPFQILVLLLAVCGACSAGWASYHFSTDFTAQVSKGTPSDALHSRMINTLGPSPGAISIIAASTDGSSILDKQILAKLYQTLFVQMMSTVAVVDGHNVSYTDLCVRTVGPVGVCQVASVFNAWGNSLPFMLNDPNIGGSIFKALHFVNTLIGQYTIDPVAQEVTTMDAVNIVGWLDTHGINKTYATELQRSLANALDTVDIPGITVCYITDV